MKDVVAGICAYGEYVSVKSRFNPPASRRLHKVFISFFFKTGNKLIDAVATTQSSAGLATLIYIYIYTHTIYTYSLSNFFFNSSYNIY